MTNKPLISPEFLRQIIRINERGDGLEWLPRPRCLFKTDKSFHQWNNRYAYSPALTSISGGYRRGNMLGKSYAAHRVMWALHYRNWPNGELDHIDGNPLNNVISNLRDVSHAVNQRNMKRCKRNKSGHTGVYWHSIGKKWRAAITYDGVTVDLGLFDDIEAAIAARQCAQAKFRFHERHGA